MALAALRYAAAVRIEVALALAACAGCASGPAPGEVTPRFTLLRPYTPEELNRDVVECSERAKEELVARESLWTQEPGAQRQALFESTTWCMRERGWRRS